MSTETFKRLAAIMRNQPLRPEAELRRLERSRTDAPPAPKPMTLAQRIVDAGERARRPGGYDPPMTRDPLALAILAAGRKRRGETP